MILLAPHLCNLNMLGHPWLLMPCYLALKGRDIQMSRDHLCHLLQHLECMQGLSTYEG